MIVVLLFIVLVHEIAQPLKSHCKNLEAPVRMRILIIYMFILNKKTTGCYMRLPMVRVVLMVENGQYFLSLYYPYLQYMSPVE